MRSEVQRLVFQQTRFFRGILVFYLSFFFFLSLNLNSFPIPEPPRFVKKLSDSSTYAGEPTTLRAVVEGSQPISVMWLKDKGEIIRESENIQISFSDNIATLQIANAETANGGKYICQIKNDAGMRECAGHLQVLGWYWHP